MEAYIITGTSGSGKTTALKAFEDLDFYCVDNIPVVLLEKFFEVIFKYDNQLKKVAVGVDIREKLFLDFFQKIFEKLKNDYSFVKIIYLDAKDEVILTRFKETRRDHPLKEDDFIKAIKLEREKLSYLRNVAEISIDTSDFNVHILKKFIYNNFSSNKKDFFKINIVSFGYKNGILTEGDLIFDVRFLINPYFIEELKNKTGNDEDVQNFIFSDKRAIVFLDKTVELLYFLLPEYRNEGKSFLIIGIGCTGGIHRSVAIANRLSNILERDYAVVLRHRDL
jgi:UPF0042 nucleotide-binding protein